MKPEPWPLWGTQDYEGQSAACKVLLVAHIFVSCNKHIETGPLRLRQQVAVAQPAPTPILGFNNYMVGQARR
jgi:hypothetical protein